MAQTQRDRLRESFKNIKYFCATSDIWTRSNRSFIAVNVHFYEPKLKTLKLQSKFIACEYFPGRHTHNRVASKLKSIFDRFDISDKVYFITTDGAGEYTAAFKYFGNNYRPVHLMTDENDWQRADDGDGGASASASADILDDSENSDDDPDMFVRTDSSDPDSSNPEAFHTHELDLSSSNASLIFTNRINCSAHKIEKLGKIDSENALGHDEEYDHYHESVFNKLQSIWNLKDSRLSAENFTRITGKKLIGPHRIRWFKTCEAVSELF